MGKSWSYSELSKLAKTNGGPEMLISNIKAGSYRKGLAAGRKECILFVAVSLCVAGFILICEEGPKFVSFVNDKVSREMSTKKAIMSEEILLNEIKEVDSPTN